MRTSIACSMAEFACGVTSVIFAFRILNSHGITAIASRFNIKNYGDRHSPPNRQFVNTS